MNSIRNDTVQLGGDIPDKISANNGVNPKQQNLSIQNSLLPRPSNNSGINPSQEYLQTINSDENAYKLSFKKSTDNYFQQSQIDRRKFGPGRTQVAMSASSSSSNPDYLQNLAAKTGSSTPLDTSAISIEETENLLEKSNADK